jgi:prepilin-type N-terminal cleavage/methylation domain-containing protein/prepilin-type processing-associated H-X9-DG protein
MRKNTEGRGFTPLENPIKPSRRLELSNRLKPVSPVRSTFLTGFTLIELLVVISIIALLMSILVPVLSRAKEAAKRAVCLHNLGQLMTVWNMYANENNDKIAGTYTSKCVCLSGCIYPKMNCNTNPPVPEGGSCNESPPIKHHSFPSWVEHPHQWNTNTIASAGSKSDPHFYQRLPDGTAYSWDFDSHYLNKENDDHHAIACGTFWKYIRDYKIYRCPNCDKGIAVSYVGADGMNGIQNEGGWCNEFKGGVGGWKTPSIYIRSQIRRPADRIVFIDMGQRVGCSWNVINSGVNSDTKNMMNGCWSSTPPVRHGNGATFGFADGHTEYHKWTGHAVTWVKNNCNYSICSDSQCTNKCSKDLFYMAKHVCGSIGGTVDQAATIAALKAAGCSIE